MAKAYIAGPMRGYPQLNFPAFDRASELGRDLGWMVVSPADIDRANGIVEQAIYDPAEVREIARRDVDVLFSFKAEEGDAIALLPGWERSTGAKAELALALWLGLRVLDAETFRPICVQLTGVEPPLSVVG